MLLRLLLCWLLAAPLGAQALLDTLAVKVCDCMDAAPELVYPRLQASRCVTRVSTTYAGRIRSELQLSTRSASDRERLGELLVDPLTAGCPLLRRLAPGLHQAELHYSDRSLLQKVALPEGSKRPPASPAAATAREAPDLLRRSGTLAQLPNGEQLRLLLDSGDVVTFALPRALSRRLSLSRNQPITVVYREDWRSDGRLILPVVVRVE